MLLASTCLIQERNTGNAVKWILKYLRGTLGVGLTFDGESNTDCIDTDVSI